MITHAYFYTYGIPVVITRFANIYGPGQLHFSALVPDIMMSILNDISPVIRSDGTPERDFIYIKDVVSVYELIGRELINKKLAGEVFNAGNGEPIKVLDFVNTIIEVTQSKLKPVIKGKKPKAPWSGRQMVEKNKLRNGTIARIG